MPKTKKGRTARSSENQWRHRRIARSLTCLLTADGKTLATVQRKDVSNFFVLPGVGSQSSETSPFDSGGERVAFFNWGTDGNLLISDFAQLVHIEPMAGVEGFLVCQHEDPAQVTHPCDKLH